MTKRSLGAAATIALLVPAVAFAEVQTINGEAGMIFKDESSTVTREQVRAAINAPLDARSHWRITGGEAGWMHSDVQYVFDGVKLVHAVNCPAIATLNMPRFKGGSGAPLPVYSGA